MTTPVLAGAALKDELEAKARQKDKKKKSISKNSAARRERSQVDTSPGGIAAEAAAKHSQLRTCTQSTRQRTKDEEEAFEAKKREREAQMKAKHAQNQAERDAADKDKSDASNKQMPQQGAVALNPDDVNKMIGASVVRNRAAIAGIFDDEADGDDSAWDDA